jgi:hypothetical protein
MKLTIACGGAATLMMMTAVPTRAHHAFVAEFDANKPVSFEKATITRMLWSNPHVWIYMNVVKPDGTVEPWAFEAGSPSALFRRGLTKDSIKAGMVVKVEGYQAKDGSKRANGRDIRLPDGRVMFLGALGTGAPYEGEGRAR